MKQKGKCQKNNIGNKKVNKKESKYKNIMIWTELKKIVSKKKGLSDIFWTI